MSDYLTGPSQADVRGAVEQDRATQLLCADIVHHHDTVAQHAICSVAFPKAPSAQAMAAGLNAAAEAVSTR